QNESGHWIYEKDDKGLRLVGSRFSPVGQKAIWELQAAYNPQSVVVGSEALLSLPATLWNTETNSFQVVPRLFRMVNGKLVDVPVEASSAQVPPAPAPTPTPNK